MDSARLYHESQVAALCGVHCLNTLLQGPYFTEIDLAQIAQELDALERQFMAEGGMESEEYKNFINQESGNVAADGMFSIQVLSKALEVWNLQVIPLDSPEVADVAAEPQQELAFICNLQEHWFTVRRTGDQWWNFNSLLPGPQSLSQFYLSAFLATLKQQGYTIFVVRGEAPKTQPGADAAGRGKWFTPEEAKVANDAAAAARQKGRVANMLETALANATSEGKIVTLKPRNRYDPEGDGDLDQPGGGVSEEERQMAAAISASLADAYGSGSAGAGPSSSYPAPAAASPQHSQQATVGDSPHISQDWGEEDDPELAMAIAASLAEAQAMADTASTMAVQAAPKVEDPGPEPDAGPGVFELAFRLPSGQRLSRRFTPSNTLLQVYGFLQQNGVDVDSSVLTTQFPKKELPASAQTLSDCGVVERQMITVDRKR